VYFNSSNVSLSLSHVTRYIKLQTNILNSETNSRSSKADLGSMGGEKKGRTRGNDLQTSFISALCIL